MFEVELYVRALPKNDKIAISIITIEKNSLTNRTEKYRKLKESGGEYRNPPIASRFHIPRKNKNGM
jgi:hypothetical protein